MSSAPFHFVSSDAYATSWISFFHGFLCLVGGWSRPCPYESYIFIFLVIYPGEQKFY